MEPRLFDAIQRALSCTIGADVSGCDVKPVGGGCINRAYVIESEPPFFVKVNSAAHEDLLDAEMDGLTALATTGSVRVPNPLVTGKSGDDSFLVLEFLPLQGGTANSWQLMGEQLAALHRCPSPDGRFGWHRDNFIGATPQPNKWHASWIDFWREQRLGFQLKLAADKGIRFDGSDRLLDRLEVFFTNYTQVPSFLHGDLWSGNASFTDDGRPVIYDPACYFGDRECELAFTELFSGFPRVFYKSYDAAWPRHEGWRSRRDLYNLYHVLNHSHLFGGSYERQAREMIRTLNASI